MEIESCAHCNRTEIERRPLEDEEDLPSYICTVCIDQQRVVRLRSGFVVLHRHLFYELPPHIPQELFAYVFPTNYRQWLSLNRCNREQRNQTLRFFLCGAPWTRNHIYDLHQRLQTQIDRGCLWKGRRYRISSWDCRTDLLTVLCNFLTRAPSTVGS